MGAIPCRFRSRLISVRLSFLSVFKPFPFCPKGNPSILVNGPDGVIIHAQSLIAQEGSRPFNDRDRARARAIATYLARKSSSRMDRGSSVIVTELERELYLARF